MQPPPLIEGSTISYQISRDVLLRIWWRRMMFRPRILTATIILAALGVGCCFALPDSFGYFGIFLLLYVALTPLRIYHSLAKAIDGNSQWIDQKTVEFSVSGLAVTGPDWRNETTWSRFKAFSEDDIYFYLPLLDNGLAAVFPKSAFTPEQQKKFRECAKSNGLK